MSAKYLHREIRYKNNLLSVFVLDIMIFHRIALNKLRRKTRSSTSIYRTSLQKSAQSSFNPLKKLIFFWGPNWLAKINWKWKYNHFRSFLLFFKFWRFSNDRFCKNVKIDHGLFIPNYPQNYTITSTNTF